VTSFTATYAHARTKGLQKLDVAKRRRRQRRADLNPSQQYDTSSNAQILSHPAKFCRLLSLSIGAEQVATSRYLKELNLYLDLYVVSERILGGRYGFFSRFGNQTHPFTNLVSIHSPHSSHFVIISSKSRNSNYFHRYHCVQ
jgi:hypothetical protein